MKKIVTSKKFIVSMAGIIAAALTAAGIGIPEEHIAALLGAIAAIVGTFNVGQGVADAGSKGRTSAGRDLYDSN